MNPMRWRILVGGLLILAGVFAMINAVTGIDLGGFVWAVLFVLGGLAFISVMASNRNHWWAAIPGFTLLGIGALIGLDQIAPRAANQIGGALVLAGIGVSFLVVYLLNRSFWWAIIPMGVMFSLVALILLDPYLSEPAIIFFLGLAATFGALALLPIDNGKRTIWPVYPAGGLLLVALIVGIGASDWAGYIMPVIVIGIGLFLVLRSLRTHA
ncbi:MAG: hypothetical protein C0396_03770 [Anaerolinea sp.]|nr:hypothetical protein [Anaerolinea sp.]